MFPKSCEYIPAESLEDASELLDRYGDGAILLAGGQSLIPMMKLRLASPKVIVDLSHIEADEIDVNEERIRLPALVTHADAVNHEGVTEHFDIIADAVPQIADPQVRNMGTVGGSLAQADPSGDWGPLVLATGGEISTVSASSGGRTIPVSEFFGGTLETCLERDEVIESVSLPIPEGDAGGAYLKIKRRQGVYAVVSVGVHLTLEDDVVGSAGVVFNSIGQRYFNPSDVEERLEGERITDELVAEAMDMLDDEIEAIDDIRGSAEFKQNACRTLFERALGIAVERARGNEVENDPMINLTQLHA